MKTFDITANVKVEIWQNCRFKIEAETEEEAIKKMQEQPQQLCVDFENLTDTEKVIEIDLKNNLTVDGKEKSFNSENEEIFYVLGDNSINGIDIDDKIREEDSFEYYIVHRKSLIDDLIRWIAECGMKSERASDKALMESDLEMLMDWEDEYIFSSNSTNHYINSEDSEFNDTCKELLELNDKIKDS